MTAADTLYRTAVQLDESPDALLNGAATAGLQTLRATAGLAHAKAVAGGAEPQIAELWQRAEQCLAVKPTGSDLYPAAAEAATLLYTAAWYLSRPDAVSDDIEVLL